MPTELHAVVSGRVQGVGFRQSTASKAQQLNLTGWVRNTRDGKVEAAFQGPQDALDSMQEWLNKGPMLARVDHLEAATRNAGTSHDTFQIII